MAENRIFAGAAIRRVRRKQGLTQLAMAAMLDISPSYLNLIERNQRPVSAAILLRMAERFDLDPRQFAGNEPGGGQAAMLRRLRDPRFADLNIDAEEVEDWLANAPGAAEAFARLFDQAGNAPVTEGVAADSLAPVRKAIERWTNHFPDLDLQAESVADELRLANADLYAALADRLREKHKLAIRILPFDVLPDKVRRLDLHARQLQLSELLDPASRTFQAAVQLALLEARDEIDALTRGADLPERSHERLFRRHLSSYFAAAVIMPYGRFLRACEATGYDPLVLQRRFGVGFEMLAHRLTTLQRVGQRGLPFFMIRVDRAGQVSKSYAGASGSALVDGGNRCPLWRLHHAFERPGQIQRQWVSLEDGTRWYTLSRTVEAIGHGIAGRSAQFAIGLGVGAEYAAPLGHAHWFEAPPVEIGLGCRQCTRIDCAQRSHPPESRTLVFDERERGIGPFTFAVE